MTVASTMVVVWLCPEEGVASCCAAATGASAGVGLLTTTVNYGLYDIKSISKSRNDQLELVEQCWATHDYDSQ